MKVIRKQLSQIVSDWVKLHPMSSGASQDSLVDQIIDKVEEFNESLTQDKKPCACCDNPTLPESELCKDCI